MMVAIRIGQYSCCAYFVFCQHEIVHYNSQNIILHNGYKTETGSQKCIHLQVIFLVLCLPNQ